nr:MAG TPA: Radical SAM domain protein, CteA SAM binding, metalloprotein, SCIFF [Caudoviricetes sp.]
MILLEVKRKAIPKSVRIAVYQKCNGHCAYCFCEIERRRHEGSNE